MTNEILSGIVSDCINRQLENDEQEIVRALHSVLLNGKNIEPDLEKLLIATVNISAQVSVQLTIRFLEEAGLLSLPADGTPILQLLDED